MITAKLRSKSVIGTALGLWLLSLSAGALLPLGTSVAAAQETAAGEEDDPNIKLIRNVFVARLGNDKITVGLVPLFGDRYAVSLTGKLSGSDQKTKAVQNAAKARSEINAVKAGTIPDEVDVGGLEVFVEPAVLETEKTAARIVKLLPPYLGDKRIAIRVSSLPPLPGVKGDRYAVLLSGVLDAGELRNAAATARAARTVINEQIKPSRIVTINESVYPASAADLSALLAAEINDDRVKVQVRALPPLPARGANPGKKAFAVVVSGVLSDQAEVADVKATLMAAVDKAERHPGTGSSPKNVRIVLGTRELTARERALVETWPISALGLIGSADATERNAIDDVVSVMNHLYGTKEKVDIIHRDGGSLYISAPEKTMMRIKGDLALIDSPLPQVQLEMWAVQVSGSQDLVGRQMDAITQDIRDTQERMGKITGYMHQALNARADQMIRLDHSPGDDTKSKDVVRFLLKQMFYPSLTEEDFYEKLKQAPLRRTMTLHEMLILMGTSNIRRELISELRGALEADSRNKEQDLEDLLRTTAGGEERARIKRQIEILRAERCGGKPFRNLEEAMLPSSQEFHRSGVENFIRAIHDYRSFVTALGTYREPEGMRKRDANGNLLRDPDYGTYERYDPDETLRAVPFAPDALKQQSAVIDGMLAAAVEAFAQDMQDMYLEPLLKRMKAGEGLGLSTKGISLIGKTRLVVTSRQRSKLEPDLVSYVETTRPAPFGDALLEAIAPAGAGGTASEQVTETDAEGKTTTRSKSTTTRSDTELSGLPKLLSGLPPAKAALLAGALLSDVAPTFNRVAPGIEIDVRPFVSLDGGSADLILKSRFGVTTEAVGNRDRSDVWAQAPPAAVQSHAYTTNAKVPGFRLFGITSFDVTTSHPQQPGRIPILSRLPLIGPAFQFPRGSRKVAHESVILVNATLLPRSLGLVGFYGAGKPEGSPPPPPPSGAAPPITPSSITPKAAPVQQIRMQSKPLSQTYD